VSSPWAAAAGLAHAAAGGEVAAGSDVDGDLVALLILAVVQGLTEFLPVSSSGHLVLGRELLGLRSVGGTLVTIALHVGTLVAVLVIYGRDLWGVLRELLAGRPREFLMIVLGSLPAAAVAFALGSRLDQLFESPDLAAGGLLVTAAALFGAHRLRRRREAAAPGARATAVEVGPFQALGIGLAQAVAILPGVSRSGSTIAAGLVCGLDAERAARFSFLLSVPAVGGAALLELRHLDGLPEGTLGRLGLALVVSAVVGVLALRLLLLALRRDSFVWFSAYCLGLALAWFLFR
jgi:undecaprenyl-diphosphatase